MTRWLILRDNLVVNVVAWDGVTEWTAPDGATIVEALAGVGPGHRLVDGQWVAPVIVTPESSEESDG